MMLPIHRNRAAEVEGTTYPPYCCNLLACKLPLTILYICSMGKEARLQNWHNLCQVYLQSSPVHQHKWAKTVTGSFWSRSMCDGPKLLGPLTWAHRLANNRR